MNKKALLIGGAVLVAGFLAYRFMYKGAGTAQKSLEDTDTTGNEDLADETGAATLEKVEVQGKPAQEAVAESEQKPIKSANDLKGTALGQAISLELASQEDLQAIDKCITTMSEPEQKVLSAIAYNSPKEVASPEFQSALTTKYGSKAKELARYNIRLNVISPGNILMPNNTWDKKIKSSKKEVMNYISTNVPTQRFVQPEEIYEICKFFIEKELGSLVGSNFVIDGGQSL